MLGQRILVGLKSELFSEIFSNSSSAVGTNKSILCNLQSLSFRLKSTLIWK